MAENRTPSPPSSPSFVSIPSEEIEKQLGDAPPFQLLETMLYDPDEGIVLLDRHLDRLTSAANFFGPERFARPDRNHLCALLAAECMDLSVMSMVRLLCGPDAKAHVEVSPVSSDMLKTGKNGSLRKVVIAKEPVNSRDIFLRQKTTHRDVYASARAAAGVAHHGIFDVILFNELGQVTETTIANIAVEDENGNWITPPVTCGLLPGVMRAEMIDSGVLTEGVITVEELLEAVRANRRVRCFNSVRGLYDVLVLLPGTELERVDSNGPLSS